MSPAKESRSPRASMPKKAAPSRQPAARGTRARTAHATSLRRSLPTGITDLDALLARAEAGVKTALARGADEAEAYVEAGASLDVELENGRIATTGASRGAGACVRLVKDGRLGFAYWTDDKDAAAAADRALQQSRLSPRRDFHFPAWEAVKALPGRWDDRVAALEVADAIGLAQELVAGAKESSPKAVLAGGGASLDFDGWALANSNGIAVADRSTSASASASLVLEDGSRSLSAGESRTAHTLGRALDARAVARDVGTTLESLRKPKPAKAKGAHDIVLRPDAALELVTGLAVSAVSGDDAMRGKTVWSEKRGQTVAAAGFDLVDDPWHAGAIGATPVDGDGLATRRLPILARGVLKTFLFDCWDGHRHKQPTTRSAVRGGFKSRPDTGTHHLVLSSPNAIAYDKVIAGVDDGFLVDSVLGAHTANVTTGDFSVTSPNVWRIRKGAIVGPVSEIAIAGNLPDLLLRLDGVAKEAKAMDGARIPAIRFRGVTVSS